MHASVWEKNYKQVFLQFTFMFAKKIRFTTHVDLRIDPLDRSAKSHLSTYISQLHYYIITCGMSLCQNKSSLCKSLLRRLDIASVPDVFIQPPTEIFIRGALDCLDWCKLFFEDTCHRYFFELSQISTAVWIMTQDHWQNSLWMASVMKYLVFITV